MDKLKSAIVVTVLAAMALVIPAAPAAAAVPGLVMVGVVGPSDSTSPKTVVATCPAGKRVIGGGVYIDSNPTSYGEVFLDDLIPTATSVRATGYEDQNGTDAVWWIRAVAVCADPLPGIELITATSVTNSSAKTATASCPSGKRAIGAGAAITGGLGQVALTTMQPFTTGAYATAFEDADGTTANWYLTSYVVCAYPPSGLEIVSAKSATNSSDKGLSPLCSAGKRALSVGWEISEPGRVLTPIARPDTNFAQVYAAENGPSVSASWTLGARVVCATP